MITGAAEREERRQRTRERFLREDSGVGIKPLDDETIRAMSRVWPPDEGVEEFFEERKCWYGEESYRQESS